MARSGIPGVPDTLNALVDHLERLQCNVFIEASTASIVERQCPTVDFAHPSCAIDLIIVVGGDGSLITAAHTAIAMDIPILGINRGRLGFLTDIHPDQLQVIDQILNGDYQKEQRFGLSVILAPRDSTTCHTALNDAVLLPADQAQMIEFSVYVDEHHVCHHRADGMIIATPTGSTAYALSGGGPILYPSLEAIVLVPMFPHTLSSRPIVIPNKSTITLKISAHNGKAPYISCDGKARTPIQPGSEVRIQHQKKPLTLIHPRGYNYFQTLREKLHWEKKPQPH